MIVSKNYVDIDEFMQIFNTYKNLEHIVPSMFERKRLVNLILNRPTPAIPVCISTPNCVYYRPLRQKKK